MDTTGGEVIRPNRPREKKTKKTFCGKTVTKYVVESESNLSPTIVLLFFSPSPYAVI